nr:MAG TPA: hypothetical protein [Caudoviricetes sp.]
MDDKNESEKIIEEMKRIGEGFNKFIESIGEALNKLFYPKEDEWKMKCPYKIGDNYWIICDSGEFEKVIWNDYNLDKEVFIAGNAFLTREAAELESKRRNLLTRFRAFRDECNGDWEPDWKNAYENKLFICKVDSKLEVYVSSIGNSFAMFGYFKNSEDAERAIELFGDEIKELFMEKRLENENN